ncbi:MAG: TonB-dependent receptor [Bacteroidales bacterium]|nr:TonB-dependent receptor [Bacteroidales bacterium]
MKKSLLLFLYLVLTANVNAQDNNLTLQFSGILFKNLADTLEKRAEVKIYYTDKWTDSLYLDIDSKNESFESVLSKALKKDGFSFIVTENNKVIISKGYTIKTNFQEQYNAWFKRSAIKRDTLNYIRPFQLQESTTTSDDYKVFKIGRPSDAGKSDRATLSGVVSDPLTGNPIIGAVIYVEKIKAGAVTNNVGYYSLVLPKGQLQIECRMVGMRSALRNVIIYSDGVLDIDMSESTNQLNEVVISANKENLVKNVRVGVEKIGMKMLKQIPMGLGEADLVKTSLLLPGVQTVGEASAGYNVRGGGADQNLVLLNGGPIINSSHFFGFSLSISGYYSNDKFDYYRKSAFDYGNMASTLKLKHTFNTKFSGQFSAIISNYNYQLDTKQDSMEFSRMYYELHQKILRADFLYFPVYRHKIEFGLDATWYSLMPGEQEPLGDFSLVTPKVLEKERAVEPAMYLSDEFELSPNFTISGGVRATYFTSFGPGTEFVYAENSPRTMENLIDTVRYGKGAVEKSYPGFEFRVSARLILSPRTSIKFGVQRVYQYLHMISNTTSISPTDIWKLSDNYIRPEMGDQYSLGLYNNFGRRAIETSIEGYYKNLQNILDYKGGAVLLMNEHIETDIINGQGKAYGIELMAKKQAGTLTGWISYTYSRVLLKVDSPYESEKVNGGKYFPANYDKPHDLKIVTNVKFSRRFNASSIFVYNTGRPITYPVAFYNFYNANRLYYSNRNEYRIPDYMRLDLSATLNGNLRMKKLNHSSLTFTVYNVLGRRNPYSIFFKNDNGMIKGYQMSIFGQPIFMVTYNFKLFGNASTDF